MQTPEPAHDRLRGVFSSQELRKVGTGTTTRKTVNKVFWFVDEDAGGKIFLQSINTNFVPTGSKRELTREELLEKYSPEPEFYIQTVYPRMRELDETVNRADQMREKGETFSAEFEYGNALAVDVENVRANFGIGLTYLSRGEVDKADNIFGRLVNLEAAFQEEHKHLFNEFGINLRKNKMLKQSLEYYQRALTLTKADENLFINIARVELELKQFADCLAHLEKALLIDPNNETALKFLAWLEAKALVDAEQVAAVRAKVLAAKNGADQAPEIMADLNFAEGSPTSAAREIAEE